MEVNKTGMLIEQMRREKNMTQAELAERAGVARCYITMLERGTKVCPIPTGMDIARALGIPFAALYEESEGGANNDTGRTDR